MVVASAAGGAGEAAALPLAGEPLVLSSKAIAANSTDGAVVAGAGDPFDVGSLIVMWLLLWDLEMWRRGEATVRYMDICYYCLLDRQI